VSNEAGTFKRFRYALAATIFCVIVAAPFLVWMASHSGSLMWFMGPTMVVWLPVTGAVAFFAARVFLASTSPR
jgi:type IV secretory pathway TrbD component